MGIARKANSRTVVGASFSEHELDELECQQRQLGPVHGRTRSTALKAMWEHFGGDAVASILQHDDVAAATAQEVAPLVEALDQISASWERRAHQRQMIGANLNQISRFVNVLRLRLREGELAAVDLVEETDRLVLVQQGIQRQLEAQRISELEDEQALAEVRALIGLIRAGS